MVFLDSTEVNRETLKNWRVKMFLDSIQNKHQELSPLASVGNATILPMFDHTARKHIINTYKLAKNHFQTVLLLVS